MGERFDCCTPKAKHGGGTWWHKVGSAWKNDQGKITVYLDSIPFPDPTKDNKCVIMLFEQKDKGNDYQRGDSQTQSNVNDDEVPF